MRQVSLLKIGIETTEKINEYAEQQTLLVRAG